VRSLSATRPRLVPKERIAPPVVPFYSQFTDIHDARWQKMGCGIASLAMIIEYYHPGVVSVDALLHEAIAAGAYAKNAGWKHRDLALLGGQYGLEGESYDLAKLDTASAFLRFKGSLMAGPVIASVHYKFDPKSTIPHLVVITGITDDRVYYNDPAARASGQFVSTSEFLAAWKKRFITFSAEEPLS
jgi:ABC-type bacteriocin/lantibiotic exporter with double-glycine peptidase domain